MVRITAVKTSVPIIFRCFMIDEVVNFPDFHDYAPINNHPYFIVITCRAFIIHGKTFIQFFCYCWQLFSAEAGIVKIFYYTA